ncbi:HD domain-containing protein [Clostridium tagluense]|uniref:3'-5' exoribonuclease YhaM family protein n=1 Tax=Clostridium tagluense TaxID=360422 RepID=UPI001C0E8633|nr:HD domain-containing protein [Clostridium tagluense]MBU3129474.1 HD domain-containing protein [Clostridium tagluense]MCB2313118.1 HD domain-containing protein [Clostridium tagluense]MCB2317884.1 HD domain-containing protein [Clostridium tagluense]MCB2322669.1 HD domain-containing protein [Clostridium tagluense]MCB2327677.1 HD domain-containing protein [Clostridium tagluense]
MEIKKISEIKKGDRVEGFFVIKSVDIKVSNNSNTNKYFDFNLGDATGDINAKLWECNEELENTLKQNILVKVKGTVNEWRGKLQLKIEMIRLAEEKDEVKIGDYVAVAPYPPEKMYDDVLNYLSKIKNTDIQNIVTNILSDNEEKLMHYPAAKSNHHAVRAGLLYHTTTMLKAGEKLSEIYTFLNTDLLYAGIILHDIGKIYEMNASELGIVSEYTIEGQLIGHIVQGIKMIETASIQVKADKEVSMLLQHMVLAHHYEAEYGSPKKPMIPEAEMLHHLDIMDARMYDMNKALTDTEQGKFSERIWSLDNISIYKSFINK